MLRRSGSLSPGKCGFFDKLTVLVYLTASRISENEVTSNMPTLSAYILREVIRDASVIFVLTLTALLLERSLRTIEAIGPSEQLLSFAFQMMANVVPIHFGEALPVAFFAGILLTFNRMNRDSELDVLHAAGIGLHQLLRPVAGLSPCCSGHYYASLGISSASRPVSI